MKATKKQSNIVQLKYIPLGIFKAFAILSLIPFYLLASFFFMAKSAELNCYKSDLEIKCDLVRETLIREHSKVEFYSPIGVDIKQVKTRKEAWIIGLNSRISFLDRSGGQEKFMLEADTKIKVFLQVNNAKHLNLIFRDDEYFQNIFSFLFVLGGLAIVSITTAGKIIIVSMDRNTRYLLVARKSFLIFRTVARYPIREIKEVLLESKKLEKGNWQPYRMIHYVHICLKNDENINIFAIQDFNFGWHKAKKYSMLIQEFIKEG
jgi:hypothetical protein